VNTPTLTPLYWQGSELVPQTSLEPLDLAATGSLTILHTNDLHSSIDARSDLGGLARIAHTIDSTRAAGPTLVVDGGDSVFGGGTWWCARDAGATSRLLSLAGYDLAAIGNHDLEHGPHSLRELLAGGRRLVSTNLVFDDEDLSQKIAPAYVVGLGGLQIGVLGLTTTTTLQLVPAAVLQGVRYADNVESVHRTVAALSPMVHSIIILSHLGFDNADDSDIHLIPALRSSKVSAILGGHSHEALDPAYVIDGIVACNAGAHGVNVNKVTFTRNAHGSVAVRAKLLPQDRSVPESERLLAARREELQALLPLQEDRVPLPPLPIVTRKAPPSGPDKDRELTLLTTALRNSGKAAADGIQMVPYLYLLGRLPDNGTISHLEVLTAYPNAERLMEMDIAGSQLKEVIGLQTRLRFYFAALPVWLHSGHEVSVDELDDERIYKVVVSQLVSEGGLDWTVLRDIDTQIRPLAVTCAEVVWNYLGARPAAS
jgi:2',3'-cyclic-nucleotide 2'-phosphodiesterase (5'-nucleotidase family)